MSGALQLEAHFTGHGTPAWLRAFERDADGALETLLVGGADLEHLQVAEPVDVLLGWLRFLAESSFAKELDGALAAWIRRFWGYPVLPGLGASATLTATAWLRAMELIGQAEDLKESAHQLRQYFPADRAFLRGMSEGASRDPEGRAWLALARHQRDQQGDDSLLESWWALCTLPPDVPWFHGEYGIDGLRHLYPPEAKGIPPQVAEGMFRLADGLAGRVADGWLNAGNARAEFLRVARSTSRAYPFPERWAAVWRSSERKCRQELAKEWAGSLLPPTTSRRQYAYPPQWILQSDPTWPDRAGMIAGLIEIDVSSAVDQARRFIDEQTRYARATGDYYYVVRSLCQFADRTRRRLPQLAVEWAATARNFDPWNAYGWSTGATALLAAKQPAAALRLAMQAIHYFPQDPFVRTAAAQALIGLKRLEGAENLYRETVALFPTDPVALGGLADVLKRLGKLHEAENLYRETVALFPTDAVALGGLADVLKRLGKLHEAESLYRKALDINRDDEVSLGGLADVLKRRGKLQEAENLYREALDINPDDEVSLGGLADVLKRGGRLPEAESLYRKALDMNPDNERSLNGLAGVLLAQLRRPEAEELLLETARRFPSDVVCRLGLALCARAERRWDQAEEWYRAVLERDPKNQPAEKGLALVDEYRHKAVNEIDMAGALDEAESMDLFDPAYVAEASPIEPAGLAETVEIQENEQPEETGMSQLDHLEPPSPRAARGLDRGVDPLAKEAAPPVAPLLERRQTAPEKHVGLRQEEIEILVLDSHLLRRWARPRREEEARSLAKRARDLLQKLADNEEFSALAASESGLLRLEQEEYDAALSLLRQAVRRFPGSARVRYTLARAEREAARRQRRRFDRTALREVVRVWDGLSDLDERLIPLHWLGSGRARFALKDGHQLTDEARRIFGQLGNWIGKTRRQEHPGAIGTDRDFMYWWAGEVERHLYGGQAPQDFEGSTDIQALESNIDRRKLILDDLEESWVARLAIT